MKKTIQGFSITEILIAITTLVIIATLAIVNYTSYSNRAYVAKMQALAGDAKVAIERFYYMRGRFPTSSAEANVREIINCSSAINDTNTCNINFSANSGVAVLWWNPTWNAIEIRGMGKIVGVETATSSDYLSLVLVPVVVTNNAAGEKAYSYLRWDCQYYATSSNYIDRVPSSCNRLFTP